jgi:dienelactone hydrolase
MYDNPGSESTTGRGLGRVLLLGPAVLSLALLASWADRGEAGLIGSPAVKKSVSDFRHGEHRITVWRYEPKAKGKHPALVMLHGLDCLGESPKHYEFIAERFAAKGYAVHFVHYFNCTPVDAKDVAAVQARVKAGLLPLMPGAEPDEQVRRYFRDWMGTVKRAVQLARAQENVDPERVGVVGFSLGGFITMALLATEPDLKLCAAVECFGGLPRELYASLTNAPPVLIFHGDRDDIVPVKEAYDLRALLKERKCQVEDKIFENCGHMFLGDNGKLRLDRVLEAEQICARFLERHLKNGVKKAGK